MDGADLLKKDEKFILELFSSERYECDFVSAGDHEIIVTNSINLKTKKQRKNQQCFYRSEVKKIHKLKTDTRTDLTTNHEAIVNGHVADAESTQYTIEIKKKLISVSEKEKIEDMIDKTVYIAQYDSHYFEALKNLKQQRFVGLRTENKFGRCDMQRAPLLAFCTWDKVYLFDIMRMGPKAFNELREIFESEYPRKIIYNSAPIADYLLHQQNCALNGFMDVMVCHMMLQKSRNVLSFEDCVAEYIDLPTEFNLMMGSKMKYHERPLTPEAKRCSASKAVLNFHLYWHLHDIMLQPIQQENQRFSRLFCDVDNIVTVAGHFSLNKYPNIEAIDLNVLDDVQREFSSKIDLNDE